MHLASDVVVIGGGIIGSAAAFFIANDPGFDGKITVIEKDNTYKGSSTTLSAASIRQQFSTPENIEISLFGIDFLRKVGEHLALRDGSQSDVDLDIGLQEKGYLLLAGSAGENVLRSNNAIQKALGADISLLSPKQLDDRFPWLNCADLSLGSLGNHGEGWFDAYSLLQLFRAKNKELGVDYINDEVVGLKSDGHKVQSAILKTNQVIAGKTFINAAGPSASNIASMAKINLPVESRKRCVFVFHCRDKIESCPLVVDNSGVYFRPEGEHFICGVSPDETNDPASCDYEVDYSLFDETIWPTLAHRVPVFESIKQVNAWAGHYAYNLLDQNAILGTHPQIDNLYFANGFSGHGLQQAPAVGRALSELILHGQYRSLDLSIFGFTRIFENTPVKEQNVI